MCLHLTIRELPRGGALPAAAEVAQASGLTVYRERDSRTPALQLFAWQRDCGCGLLEPGAKIDSEVWHLGAAFLPQIAEAVRFVSRHVKRFGFSALYFGESPTTEIVVPIRELREVIIANRIRNHFHYIVVRKPAGVRSAG